MGIRCRFLLFLAAAASLAASTAYAQDSPSLGDLARQQRQQKEQQKTTSGLDAKESKVITNEEIPEHAEPAATKGVQGDAVAIPESLHPGKLPAEHWKSQIAGQKSRVAMLQRQIDELSESVRFAPADCAANCVGRSERQREKQLRVERMQAQLEEQKRRLEALQESARKQGYGSSVYDP